MAADKALRLAFILSATDKMSRIVDEAVKKSTDKLSAFERNTSKAGRSMMKAGTVMAGAGVGIGAAVLGAGKSLGDYAGDVKDMSEATGVGTEAWQKMIYAAKISGIEQEKLMTSMVKFDKQLVAAAGGSKSAAQIFTDLGISIKDAGGKLRAPEEIFKDVAETLSKVENGAAKTAAATEFFGKSGAELLPMLNEGKTGLEQLYKAAEDTGNVMSGDALYAADEFGKKLDAIGLQTKGMMLQLGSSLMPILSTLQQHISNIISKISNWIKANPELASTIGKIVTIGGGLLIALGAMSVVLGVITFAVGKLGAIFRGTMAIFKAGKAVIGGVRAAIGFTQVAIAGMRGTTIAANSATRAYMVTQGVATKSTKAYAIGMRLAKAAQWLFNTSLMGCPVVWIVAAIAAVIAAVVLLVKNWDAVAAFFKRLWDSIKKIFVSVWEWIKNMFLDYTPVGLVIKHWDAIADWFTGLWDGVKNIFSSTWEWIKNMFLNYTPHGLIIKHWDTIAAWFSRLWDSVANVFTGAWDGIKNFFAGLNPIEWLGTMWAGVSTFFSDLWGKFYNWGAELINGLIDGIVGMAKKAVDSVKNVGKKIASGFKSFFGINSPSKLFAQYGVNITQGLAGGITKGEGDVVGVTDSLAVGASNGAKKSIENAAGGGALQTIRNIAQSISSNSVDASQSINNMGGASINYSPNITINGSDNPETKQDFLKLLKSHRDEIINMVKRETENKKRLSFN